MTDDLQAGNGEHPTGSDDFRPFPVNSLPQKIRRIVTAAATSIGCDTCYLALPLLVAMASAIGNSRRLELKRGWSAPSILWGATVAESGTAKTPAFQLVMKPVHQHQENALKRHDEAMKMNEANLERWERDMSVWKRDKKVGNDPPAKPETPQAERFIVSDTTVEALAPILLANPRGLLLARDELAGWFGSFDRYSGKGTASADSAHWLSMFSGEAMLVDRKTGSRPTIYVPQATISVIGGIQPAIFKKALGAEHRASGMAARLLLCSPPRIQKKWTEADIDPADETELHRLFSQLYGLQPTTRDDGKLLPVLLTLQPEAKKLWVKYFDAHSTEQVELTGDLSAAWSKLEEYAARLALVIHLSRWASGESVDVTVVDATSMSTGIALTQWFKHEAKRVYAMLDESNAESEDRQLLEWIERHKGCVTAREVQNGCRWLKDTGTAEAALEALVKSRRGIWESSPPGQRGHPTRRFKLL